MQLYGTLEMITIRAKPEFIHTMSQINQQFIDSKLNPYSIVFDFSLSLFKGGTQAAWIILVENCQKIIEPDLLNIWKIVTGIVWFLKLHHRMAGKSICL